MHKIKGTVLHDLLKKRGMTNVTLSKNVGISTRTINPICTSKCYNIRPGNLEKIVIYLAINDTGVKLVNGLNLSSIIRVYEEEKKKIVDLLLIK
jgi:DNA-binding Xre family transcriptional regulator